MKEVSTEDSQSSVRLKVSQAVLAPMLREGGGAAGQHVFMHPCFMCSVLAQYFNPNPGNDHHLLGAVSI